ncbi:hypothetical protein [Halorarius litoreus]|uniref:hypothetical protein n=1 Tax=Halorarius litoreus TaxID=2962676 RepID=UPI0020CBE61B|nr:hypothetical protein [Halorarius litoreus]
MPATRRAFVLAAATGLAGCTAMPDDNTQSPPGSQSTDTDESSPAQSTPDGCTMGYHVTVEAFAPVADLPMTVEGPERDLVAAAVAEGDAGYETYGQSPLRDGVVAHEGAYYWLTVTEAGTETVPAYLFDISWENGRTAPDDATLYAYEDLPANDREAIRFLVPDGEGDELGGHPTQSFSGRERPVPYPDGGDESTLLPADNVWVRYDGREYRVTTGSRTTTDLHRYRYTADQVAESDADLRAWATERYVVDLSLSETQRDLLDRASGDYYEECAPASDALEGIQEQLSDDVALSHGGGWYVAVDDTRHRLEILQWVE